MSWVEIIKVQTADRQAAVDCTDYLETLKRERSAATGPEVRVYNNAAFLGQHMISLKWHSPLPEMPSSEVSRVLVHKLKKFGLVDHSIWVDSGNGAPNRKS